MFVYDTTAQIANFSFVVAVVAIAATVLSFIGPVLGVLIAAVNSAVHHEAKGSLVDSGPGFGRDGRAGGVLFENEDGEWELPENRFNLASNLFTNEENPWKKVGLRVLGYNLWHTTLPKPPAPPAPAAAAPAV